MADLTGSFVSINPSNISTEKTSVQQLVDIVQSDISSINTNTRKSYEVFTSGNIDTNQNISSSLFQTVYDQDFSLGTANALFDISIGSLSESNGEKSVLINEVSLPLDDDDKINTSSNQEITMIREKVNIYRQFAQNLLGSSESSFFTPHDATVETTDQATITNNPGTYSKKIRGAIFICFKRLFTRDNIYKGSFGLRIRKNASTLISGGGTVVANIDSEVLNQDVNVDAANSLIYDDRLSITNLTISPVAGEVATLADSSGNYVGLIYYDSGIIVLDVERAFNPSQIIRGLITTTRAGSSTNDLDGPFWYLGDDGTNGQGYYYPLYTTDQDSTLTSITFGELTLYHDPANVVLAAADQPNEVDDVHGLLVEYTEENQIFYTDESILEFDGTSIHEGSFYPSLWTKGTIDDVIDHICTTRFDRDQRSAITFRNETVINSSLIFCRASHSQFNYSTNPTYTDANNAIIAKTSDGRSFTYITTVGLYDAEGFLLAVAKTSRPIEKNPSTDLSIRIRLDY